jgi:hypothetical protein
VRGEEERETSVNSPEYNFHVEVDTSTLIEHSSARVGLTRGKKCFWKDCGFPGATKDRVS